MSPAPATWALAHRCSSSVDGPACYSENGPCRDTDLHPDLWHQASVSVPVVPCRGCTQVPASETQRALSPSKEPEGGWDQTGRRGCPRDASYPQGAVGTET